MKVIFLINKYSPLFDTTLAIVEQSLWEFNRHVVTLLVGAAVMMLPFALYVVSQVASSAIQYPDSIVRVLGCVPCVQDQDAWPAYACLICAETGIIVITLLKRKSAVVVEGISEGAVFHTMYRDGTAFFAIVLALSILNLLVMLLAPQELSSFMQMPLRVVHSALCTRVLLNLRKAAARSSGQTLDGYTDRQTTLAFDHTSTGQSGDTGDLELEDLGYHDS
ncbi:hypothetical protein BD309DRAFT_991780 [Dichomitus squalens]|nr:hypothetical protein BD309DRAFT_991780 [Dichomitus squalens]